MRIAIPIWEHRISPVLDSASRLLVLDMENQAEKYRFEIYLDEQDLTRKCHRIQGMGVDVLICSAVSKPFARLLEVAGIHVIPEISGKTEEVLDAYFKGDLIQGRFSTPGHRRKDRHGTQGRASPPRKQKGQPWQKKPTATDAAASRTTPTLRRIWKSARAWAGSNKKSS